jgi:amidophosphoribosyltransferase
LKHHRPTHECGVFAVFGHPNAAILTYYGLFALQHRGQESAGIVTADGPDVPFKRHVAMGLVGQVFSENTLERLKGNRAVGHVRYSTYGFEHGRECATARREHGPRTDRHRT